MNRQRLGPWPLVWRRARAFSLLENLDAFLPFVSLRLDVRGSQAVVSGEAFGDLGEIEQLGARDLVAVSVYDHVGDSYYFGQIYYYLFILKRI